MVKISKTGKGLKLFRKYITYGKFRYNATLNRNRMIRRLCLPICRGGGATNRILPSTVSDLQRV